MAEDEGGTAAAGAEGESLRRRLRREGPLLAVVDDGRMAELANIIDQQRRSRRPSWEEMDDEATKLLRAKVVRAQPWCMDRRRGRDNPDPVRGQAMRT